MNAEQGVFLLWGVVRCVDCVKEGVCHLEDDRIVVLMIKTEVGVVCVYHDGWCGVNYELWVYVEVINSGFVL